MILATSPTREHYRKPLPKYVERELRGLLRCGDPWHGFTRVRCPRCRHEFFVDEAGAGDIRIRRAQLSWTTGN